MSYQTANAHVKYRTKKELEYNTPFCGPYQVGRLIYHETRDPVKKITTNDMCPFNNSCADSPNYVYLNERGVKPSPFFKEEKGEFLKKTYASTVPDGRLVDIGRGGFTQTLDCKPIQVYYDLIHDNVSGNKELDSYGLGYKSYETTHGGQIQYYIDREIADPFFSPIYGLESEGTGVLWEDPMSSRKVQFLKEYPKENQACLSWIQDSSSFRDDITSLQQNKFNEQRFDLVYGRI